MSDQALTFGKLHDVLAVNAQPVIHIIKSNDVDFGSVTIRQTGIYVHPNDSERIEAVVTAAGWKPQWSN